MSRGASWRFGSLLCCAALFACGSPPKRGDVAKEWNVMMRELGINPVFPPREDLQVGDVYLRRGDPATIDLSSYRSYIPIDLWVASLLPEQIPPAHYERRHSFPDSVEADSTKLVDDQGKVKAGGYVKVPRESADGVDAFSKRDLTRLRQVAFPDFMSMTVQAGDLRAFVPIQALSLAFGASWQNEQQMDVKIPAAESYGVPYMTIKPKLFEGKPGSSSALLSSAIAEQGDLVLLRDRLRSMDATDGINRDCDGPYVYLDVITEVFYARVMDISITRKYDVGVRARVATVSKEDVSTTTTTSPSPDGATTATTSTTSTTKTEGVANAEDTGLLTGDPISRAAQLNERLKDVDTLDKVGGTFSFVSVSSSSVGMRRAYDRPIAVGWRGLTLKVNVYTREVAGVGAQSNGDAVLTGGKEISIVLVRALQEVLRDTLNATGAPPVQVKYSVVSFPITDKDSLVLRASPMTAGVVFTPEQIKTATAITTTPAGRGAVVQRLQLLAAKSNQSRDPSLPYFINAIMAGRIQWE